MTTYSIEKVGSDYVVKVDDQSVMKVGSRRRAAQLVADASELLDETALVPEVWPPSTDRAAVTNALPVSGHAPVDDDVGPPSITRDTPKVA